MKAITLKKHKNYLLKRENKKRKNYLPKTTQILIKKNRNTQTTDLELIQ